VGAQAGRQELVLELERGGDVPLLTATLKDKVSLPAPATSLSRASGMRQALTPTAARGPTFASAAGRYILSAPPGTPATLDNNAQLLVQLLTSGRVLWTSRLTRYSGSGSASLTAPSGNLLVAALYEGRAVSAATGLTSNALFGELRLTRTLAGWEAALEEDRLEHARTKVSGSRQESRFVAAYSATDFASGAQFSDVRNVDFGNAFEYRVPTSMVGSLFGAGLPALRLIATDPLGGGSAGFSWNVTVSASGVVRTSGIVTGGVTPPVLSLRLDRLRGDWSGSYTSGGVRRSLIGCVLDAPSSRGRGWFETESGSGRWELRLGP
jgi:hypothetical protein